MPLVPVGRKRSKVLRFWAGATSVSVDCDQEVGPLLLYCRPLQRPPEARFGTTRGVRKAEIPSPTCEVLRVQFSQEPETLAKQNALARVGNGEQVFRGEPSRRPARIGVEPNSDQESQPLTPNARLGNASQFTHAAFKMNLRSGTNEVFGKHKSA